MDLQNNNNNDSISNVDLNTEQKTSMLSKIASAIFGGSTTDTTNEAFMYGSGGSFTTGGDYVLKTTTGTSTSPVVININGGGEIAKSEEAVEEAIDKDMNKSADEADDQDGGNEMDLEKITDALSALLDEKLSKMKDEVKEEIEASFTEKLDSIEKSVGEVTEKVTETTEKVEKIDDASAVKKSADDDGDDDGEKIEKRAEPFWGNVFLPQTLVEAHGF